MAGIGSLKRSLCRLPRHLASLGSIEARTCSSSGTCVRSSAAACVGRSVGTLRSSCPPGGPGPTASPAAAPFHMPIRAYHPKRGVKIDCMLDDRYFSEYELKIQGHVFKVRQLHVVPGCCSRPVDEATQHLAERKSILPPRCRPAWHPWTKRRPQNTRPERRQSSTWSWCPRLAGGCWRSATARSAHPFRRRLWTCPLWSREASRSFRSRATVRVAGGVLDNCHAACSAALLGVPGHASDSLRALMVACHLQISILALHSAGRAAESREGKTKKIMKLAGDLHAAGLITAPHTASSTISAGSAKRLRKQLKVTCICCCCPCCRRRLHAHCI